MRWSTGALATLVLLQLLVLAWSPDAGACKCVPTTTLTLRLESVEVLTGALSEEAAADWWKPAGELHVYYDYYEEADLDAHVDGTIYLELQR